MKENPLISQRVIIYCEAYGARTVSYTTASYRGLILFKAADFASLQVRQKADAQSRELRKITLGVAKFLSPFSVNR